MVVTAFSPQGAIAGTTTVSVPANGNVFVRVEGDLGISNSSGSLQIAHTGTAGAITANTTVLSPLTGISFDAPFVPRMSSLTLSRSGPLMLARIGPGLERGSGTWIGNTFAWSARVGVQDGERESTLDLEASARGGWPGRAPSTVQQPEDGTAPFLKHAGQAERRHRHMPHGTSRVSITATTLPSRANPSQALLVCLSSLLEILRLARAKELTFWLARLTLFFAY